MIPIAEIRAGLLALVQDLCSDPRVFVCWRDQARQHIDPTTMAEVKLHLNPARAVGMNDDIRQTWDLTKPVGQEGADVICMVRNATLSIVATSLEQDDDHTALTYIEQIRTRLAYRSSKARLRELGCAWVKCHDTQDLSEMVDDRPASVASLDLVLRTQATDTDEGHRFGWIETVEVTRDVS